MASTTIKEKKKAGRVKRWFGTSFATDNVDWAKKIWEASAPLCGGVVKYFSGQMEKCPTTGKLHWQFIIHFYERYGLRAVRKVLGMGKGKDAGDLSPQFSKGACQYVHKDETSVGNRFEFGKASGQGFRTDLDDIRTRIIRQVKSSGQSESMLDIANDHFGSFVRYHQGFKEYKKLVLEEASQEFRTVDVEFITGPTGAGKTRKFLYDKKKGDEMSFLSTQGTVYGGGMAMRAKIQ